MTIRPAQPLDAAAMAAAHVAAWQGAYRGLLPDELLRNLSVEQRRQRWEQTIAAGRDSVLVKDVDGRIAGMISFGPSRDSDAQKSPVEIYSLNLDPADWRKGYGTALIEAAHEQLRRDGYGEVSLWVLQGNQRACRFYERMGYALDGATKVERDANGVEAHELRYRRAL